MSRVFTEAKRFSPETDPLRADLSQRYVLLRRRFETESVVKDRVTGFIVAAFMNKEPLDYGALADQAAILSCFFEDARPTRIIGIPNSGIPLALAVAENFPDASFIEAIKTADGEQPNEWTQPVALSVQSFTRNKIMNMFIESVEPGERYLVVDDVIARGSAAAGFIHAIQNRGGIVIGLAAGFDKQFQQGLNYVINTCSVSVASVISVTGITSDNRVILE